MLLESRPQCFRRLTAFVRTVKLGAIDQRATVVDRHNVTRFGRLPTAIRQDFVLKTAGQRDHARFGLVLGQELLAFLFVLFALLFSLLLLFGADFLVQGHHRFANLLIGQC